MRPKPTAASLVATLAGMFPMVLGVWCITSIAPMHPSAQPGAPTSAAMRPLRPEEPPFRGLDSNLFMQTSAEYRACCLQAYNLATLRLREKVAAFRATNATGPLAVAMDLDETVLDNAGFQAAQLRSALAYEQRLWDLWEVQGTNKIGLIPGAGPFIGVATNLHVDVVFISNRGESSREFTKQILSAHGLAVPTDSHLLLSNGSSDKTERRRLVESSYTVLLHVGDNLRDFKESYKAPPSDRTKEGLMQAIEARKRLVDADHSLWGDSFIILPNPAYGEWMKPLGNGKADLDLLVPEK